MSPLVALAFVLVVVFFCFVFVLLFGAPFLPTLRPQVEAALDLLDLAPGQTMLELGCGDGRVLIAAAKRGIKSVGYELNPILAVLAWARTRRYGNSVHVIWGDYWHSPWPDAQGIFAFILPRYMGKLHKKVMQYPHKPVKVASFAFEINEMPAMRKNSGIFLYLYERL